MKRSIGTLAVASCFLFTLIGCKKIECENAKLCIRNNSADTVFFCWGCNVYAEYIEPVGITCKDVGYISYDPYSGSGSLKSVPFHSSAGSYIIDVQECYVEKIIE